MSNIFVTPDYLPSVLYGAVYFGSFCFFVFIQESVFRFFQRHQNEVVLFLVFQPKLDFLFSGFQCCHFFGYFDVVSSPQSVRHTLCNPVVIHIIATFARSFLPFLPSFEDRHAL